MSIAGIARAGQSLCLGGAALGALGLIGWLSGTEVATMFVRGLPRMMPNTALALTLIGVAGAARRREETRPVVAVVSSLAAVVVLALGAGTLAEYGLGIDLHIDRLLVPNAADAPSLRPSPPTALALALLAVALLVFDTRRSSRVRPAEWLILCAALTAFTALVGIILEAGPLYRMTRLPVIGVSLPTAISLLLTSAGLLLERPSIGVMGVAASRGPGGTLLRRLTLPIFVIPVALGFVAVRIAALEAVEDIAIPIAIMAAGLTAGGLLVLVVTTLPLDRAHAQLMASRAETQRLVEQAPDGIFIADLNGHYTDVNDAGCRMLGHPREEIIGRTIVDLIPPEDVSRLWQDRDVLLGGGTKVAEWRLRRRDGSYFPVEVSTRILPDGRWQAFVRDISERKRLEEQAASARAQLRESEERFRLAIDEAPIGMALVALDGRFMRVNYVLCEIVGYSAEELTALTFQDIAHADDLHADVALAGQLYRGEIPRYQLEKRYIRKDGAIVHVMLSTSILRDSSGEPVCYIAQLEDITGRKRSEGEHRFLAEAGPALARSLDYDETLSQVAEIGVGGLSDLCIVDVIDDAGELRRVRVAAREPAYGGVRDVLQRVPLDRRQGHLVRSAMTSTQPVLMQHASPEDVEAAPESADDHRALNGLRSLSVIVIPLVLHGKAFGAMSFLSVPPSRPFDSEDARVVTQLVDRAALAIENARLFRAARRAIQVRDEVLGIVAHDLRNPLGAMLIEVEFLRRSAARLDTDARKSVEAIKASGARMNRLIQDLLDVTRLEAGPLAIEGSRLPATTLIADAFELCKGLASWQARELWLDVQEALPDLWADRDRLLQVFDNLVGNALKFSRSGAGITLGAASRDHEVLFWEADSGPGISVEDQAHLFDRFWQARAAGRGGAGLGLPIVKGIVEAHCGRVWVESEPGRGSTFLFTIPTADYVAHTSAAPALQSPAIEARRVSGSG